MPCYHPSSVSVLRQARTDEARRADEVTVPCGSCLGCRANQAGSWAVRIMHESLFPRRNPDGTTRVSYFATLTYSPENLPENGSLVPEDLQGFFKRLRKRLPGRSLKYYAAGEYGETTARPHYHAVLFGPQFLARELHTHRHGAPVWLSDDVAAAWPLGHTELTGLTAAGAMYIAGYLRKKQRRAMTPYYEDPYDRVNPLTGEVVEIAQEFSRMSRRPAIGRRWIEEFWRDVYPRDFVLLDGVERKPPRYYDKWMEDNQPQVMEEVRQQRFLDAEQIGDPKLIMKEKIHRARVALFSSRDKV